MLAYNILIDPREDPSDQLGEGKRVWNGTNTH